MKSLKRKISHLRLLPISTFLPLLFWPASAVYLSVVPPSGPLSFIIFYLLISGALFFTLRLRLSLLYSVIFAITIVTVFILRQLHLANTLNMGILMGIALLSIYSKKIMNFRKRTSPDPPPEESKDSPAPPHSTGLVRPFPPDMFNES